MPSMIKLAVFALAGTALALPANPDPTFPTTTGPTFPTNKTCGEVNIFYTGFTAYHPYVIAQGLDPHEVDGRLRKGAAGIVKAGYNLRVLFQGPEQPVTNIGDRLKGTEWGATGQGMGIRGYANATATLRFEDNLYEFARVTPNVPTVFNWGPDTFADSVVRRIPLIGNCTDKPGKLIAYEEKCDPDVCEKVTVILDGDMDKLLEGTQ